MQRLQASSSTAQRPARKTPTAQAKPTRKAAEKMEQSSILAAPPQKLPTSVPEVKAAIERQFRAAIPKDVTFRVGDKAVHPAHGVGEVTAIEKRDIGGKVSEFYVLRILEKGMKVMVPTVAVQQVGLRRIMSQGEAEEILETIRAREVAVDVQPWSRRFRIYTEMVNSGAAVEIAKVYRDMNRLKFDKDLSFGERKLLDQARSLLLKELAFAKNKTESDMATELQQIFCA